MREIKFRAIKSDSGEWVYGGSIIKFKDEACATFYMPSIRTKCIADHDEFGNMTNIKGSFYLVENVCQYTGLKDKNGTEIYEGDIVHCIELRNDKISEYISEVFLEDGCLFVHESKTCDVELYLYENRHTKLPLTEIEIIGNIYQNPELLEQ